MDDFDLFSESHGQQVDELLAQVRDLLENGTAPDGQTHSPAPDPEVTTVPAVPQVLPDSEPTRRVELPPEDLERTRRFTLEPQGPGFTTASENATEEPAPVQEVPEEKEPVVQASAHKAPEPKIPVQGNAKQTPPVHKAPAQNAPAGKAPAQKTSAGKAPEKKAAVPEGSAPRTVPEKAVQKPVADAKARPAAAPSQKAQEPSPDKPLTARERRALERQRRSEEPGFSYRSTPPTGYFWTSTKAALYVLGVLAASVLIALCLWFAADDVFGLTSQDQSAQVHIAREDSLAVVADKLQEAGIIKYPSLFRLYGRLFHAADKIQPGDYTLNAMFDYRAVVVGMMGSYKARETTRVTIPEGYSAAQIFGLLESSGVCSEQALSQAAAEYDFGYDFLEGSDLAGAARLEGFLFPDTYEFYLDDDAENVLDKLLSNFKQKFTADMAERLEELNAELTQQANSQGISGSFQLTMQDIVTVASLIEKEASTSAERTTVASVIYNRLTDPNYPLLQIDATVLYALGDWTVNLTYSDLEYDSPYNTYLYEGLPAGPICNPGINCLKAALYPAQTEYYYYALGPDGTHHFSHDSAEHQAFLDTLEE